MRMLAVKKTKVMKMVKRLLGVRPRHGDFVRGETRLTIGGREEVYSEFFGIVLDTPANNNDGLYLLSAIVLRRKRGTEKGSFREASFEPHFEVSSLHVRFA